MKGSSHATAKATADESDLVFDEVIASMTDTEAARLAGCPALKWLTVDDHRQQLQAELIDRAGRHRPSRRGGSARAWAKPVLRSIRRDLVREATCLKRQPQGKVQSLDEPAGPDTHAATIGELVKSSMPGPCERLIEKERRDQIGLVVASLPNNLKLLCGLLQEGSGRRAQDRLCLSRRRFERDIEDLKQVFELAGLAPDRPVCAHAVRN